ncbi:MAG TPA: 1-deoxy-D-xylulose-5-phosphate reductoisomerase [Candidatus Avilachnospira avicola]|nr:1-deoxy-D-xylulose-5-phosphate reductoisomerase [Candidatus Avilachnospira avicola]
MSKNISILGSTGSIGRQALEIVRSDSDLRAVALAARSDIRKLKDQIYEFRPRMVCVYDRDKMDELYQELRQEAVLSAKDMPELVSGMEGLCKAASFDEADTSLISVVGMIGIRPTIAAIRAHKKIALANKETLVCAGHIIMPMVREEGVELMPIDSEHSAIYQCLMGEEHESISRILLTASGGPFRGKKREELSSVGPEDALRHPNWSMGAKITIDSATMVNKALEVMEARWLFDVGIDQIDPIIQPRSIIHSMVEFRDGAIKAQLGAPSMLVPIAFSLYAPKRPPIPSEPKLDLLEVSSISFEKPDMDTFKGLALGIEAGKQGGLMPTVFNAANEEAVSLFLGKKIGFLDIADGIGAAMQRATDKRDPELSDILMTEEWSRSFIRQYFNIGEQRI